MMTQDEASPARLESKPAGQTISPLSVLLDYVERSTHWKKGGADRHAALLALKALQRQPGADVPESRDAGIQPTAPSNLRGIDAGPISEWVHLVQHGCVSKDERLIAVKDIPKWVAQNTVVPVQPAEPSVSDVAGNVALSIACGAYAPKVVNPGSSVVLKPSELDEYTSRVVASCRLSAPTTQPQQSTPSVPQSAAMPPMPKMDREVENALKECAVAYAGYEGSSYGLNRLAQYVMALQAAWPKGFV